MLMGKKKPDRERKMNFSMFDFEKEIFLIFNVWKNFLMEFQLFNAKSPLKFAL